MRRDRLDWGLASFDRPKDEPAARLARPIEPGRKGRPTGGAEQMQVEIMETRRPGIITAICIIGFIGVAAAIPLIFSDASRQIGVWYPPYLAFGAVVGLVCMTGLWMMKKWSVIGYTALFGVNQAVLLSQGFWNGLALILPGIVIAIGLSKYRLMK